MLINWRTDLISAEKKARINTEVRVPEVRLIDAEGNQVGIVTRQEALQRAADVSLDLVEISPNAEPPVCKIMDYGKYLFQANKKQAAAKKAQKKVGQKTKRLRIGLRIDKGDYQVKLRNLIRFLEDGDRVEISLRFKGREIAHKELGLELLQRMKADLSEYGDVEREPGFEGRQMMMVIVPKKTK